LRGVNRQSHTCHKDAPLLAESAGRFGRKTRRVSKPKGRGPILGTPDGKNSRSATCKSATYLSGPRSTYNPHRESQGGPISWVPFHPKGNQAYQLIRTQKGREGDPQMSEKKTPTSKYPLFRKNRGPPVKGNKRRKRKKQGTSLGGKGN